VFATLRDTKGLGNAALYVRLRDAAGRFWNWTTTAWVDAESADTKINLREYPDSDALESRYSAALTVPDEQVAIEYVRASDGAVRAYEDTVPYGQLVVTGSVPVAPDVSLCTLYEYLRHPHGAPAVGATVRLKIVALPFDYQGALFAGSEVQATADAAGVVTWVLPRGATVYVVSSSLPFGIARKAARVPDAGVASLSANWVPELTGAEIDALGAPAAGTVVFDTGKDRLVVYTGMHWKPLAVS
jgi:hypothetical protein